MVYSLEAMMLYNKKWSKLPHVLCYSLCVYICIHTCVPLASTEHVWMWEGHVWESLLSFHHVGFGDRTWVLRLGANTIACWAISPAHIPVFYWQFYSKLYLWMLNSDFRWHEIISCMAFPCQPCCLFVFKCKTFLNLPVCAKKRPQADLISKLWFVDFRYTQIH